MCAAQFMLQQTVMLGSFLLPFLACGFFHKSGGGGKDHNKDISCSFKHYLYIEKLTEGILLISFIGM